MKQKVLAINFYKNGEKVDILSKCPCSADVIISALHFLEEGCKIAISLQDYEVNLPNTEKRNV